MQKTSILSQCFFGGGGGGEGDTNSRKERCILFYFLFFYFNTCTVHLSLICIMTNKCKINSQIITLLHVLTLACHPLGARHTLRLSVYQATVTAASTYKLYIQLPHKITS
jgi:hypothetical protein